MIITLTAVVAATCISAALKLSHRGYVLEAGKVVLSGSSKELLNSALIRESYLEKKY
jgi:branched-chain amino acid transport system ATP-binding protein